MSNTNISGGSSGGAFVTNQFISDLRNKSATLHLFKCVKSKTFEYGTSITQEMYNSIIGRTYDSESGATYNNSWFFPEVQFDDDVVTVRFVDDEITDCKSIFLIYDKYDSSDNGSWSYNQLAMIIPESYTNTDTNETVEFRNYAENYVQFDFRTLSGLKCNFDNCNNVRTTEASSLDYPARTSTKQITVTDPNTHSHNVAYATDTSSYYNANNVVDKLVSYACKYNNEFVSPLSSSSSSSDMYIDNYGRIYVGSNQKLADKKGSEFIETLGVADFLYDDSIHTDYALVNIV